MKYQHHIWGKGEPPAWLPVTDGTIVIRGEAYRLKPGDVVMTDGRTVDVLPRRG